MVKKLIKHEFIYYLRTLTIFLPWVFIMGILTRIVLGINNQSVIIRIAKFSSTSILILSAYALIIFYAIVCIVRFYKNMYSSEGYLTFTLPVTNVQHIFVKLLVGQIVMLIGLAVVGSSLLIAFSDNVFVTLGKIFSGLGILLGKVPTVHLVFYIIELLLIVLIGAISTPLLDFACISIGQMARKNRILAAIGVYFIYSIIMQIISSVFMVIFAMFMLSPVFNSIIDFIGAHPFATLHCAFLVILIISALMTTIYFYITLRVMNKKLNLE